MAHRIGIMGGDGIGPEVVAEGLKVIDALGIEYERIDYDLGGERYLKDGTILTDEIIEEWRGIDALYARSRQAVHPGCRRHRRSLGSRPAASVMRRARAPIAASATIASVTMSTAARNSASITGEI